MGAVCGGSREKQDALLVQMESQESLEKRRQRFIEEEKKWQEVMQRMSAKQDEIIVSRKNQDEELKKQMDTLTAIPDMDSSQANGLKGEIDACKSRITDLRSKIAEVTSQIDSQRKGGAGR